MDISRIMYEPIMFLNCIFEVFLLYNFLAGMFPLYEERKWGIRLKALGFILTIFIINNLEIPLLNLFCIPILYMLFVWVIFRIEFKLNVVFVIFYYVILAVTEFVFQHIYRALGIDLTEVGFSRIFVMTIEKIFEFVVIQAVRKRNMVSSEGRNYNHLKSLFVLPISTLVLLNGFLSMHKQPYGYFLICLGGVLIIVSNILNFSIVERLLESENAIRVNEMLQLKTTMEQNHYRRMEEINAAHAEYIHEIRHLVKTMKRLAETEEGSTLKALSSEAAELMNKNNLLNRINYMEDPIMNAIFMEREQSAKDRNLSYQIQIQPDLDISFISDLDKIRIFGNLLDNALEAAAVCKDGYVSARLYKSNEFIVVFLVENNFCPNTNKKGVSYLTTKSDQMKHGFGIRNVEELAEKYNGMLKISEEADTFLVTLVLSSVQKTEKS